MRGTETLTSGTDKGGTYGQGEFTDEQQELEQIADDALSANVQPFKASDIKSIIARIEGDTDDERVASLRESLFNRCGEGLADNDFTQLVNTFLAVFDMHGFADEASRY